MFPSLALSTLYRTVIMTLFDDIFFRFAVITKQFY